MSDPLFKGVMPALVTPFLDGAVDEQAFVALVERQIAGGVHGLVPVGTTGETATLSHDEHRRVVELCVKTTKGRVPVVAGAGSNSTEEAIELVRHAKTIGADAALVVTPYYNRPSQEGLYAHYAAINEAVQLPVLVYNVPGRTSVDITDATLARLSKLPNIVGIKDAAPDLCATFYNAALGGDWKTALYWQDRLLRLHKGLFADASPSPTKFALAHLGLCREDTRLPIVACSEAAREIVLDAMREAGVIN